ncbi:MAG: hypothetical protein IPI69_13525 [Bacteroidales bacterium]|nr:hypothetical protein [Bacteroidales bacterium]
MIPLKNQNTLSKNIAKPAGLGLYCPGSRLTFALLFGFISVFGVVVGVCWWIDKSSKGNKNKSSGLCVGLVFIELATFGERRLFTVLFYL